MLQERDSVVIENKDVGLKLSGLQADYQRLEDLLDRVQEDKRRLSHRVNKLTANGKYCY